MADLQKTVEIIFGGRNDLSKTIGEVERSLSSLNSASAPFADLAINALKAEAAIIGMGAAAAGLSIAAAGEFSGQFAEITTLIDGSADSLGDYRQAILDYSSESTQSLDEINGALYAAISAGVDYEDSLDAVRIAEQLAVAGKADLGSTMTGLVSTLNAYGAGMDEAEDYADIFFTTVKEGQTTIPELNASLAQVTSVAAAAGVPFDDLGAAIAALTASGMPTSQAITSIKSALSNIIKPTADAKTVAEELGIQFNSTALEAMGLNGFLEMVWEATDGNIDVMSRLFGSVEGLAGVLSLAGGESGKFADALEAMESRAGSAESAFEKMVDNFDLQNQKLANNVRGALVAVGDQLLSGYGDIISALTANIQGVIQAVNAGDFDGLIGIFQGVMADIAKLLEGTAQILPEAIAKINWDQLAGSFDNLQAAVKSVMDAIFGDVDLTTVDGMAAGMQTFVNSIANLTNINAGIISALPGFFSAIVTVLEQISKLSPEQFELIGKALGSALLLNVATDGISNVATTVAAAVLSFKSLASISTVGITALATSVGALLAPFIGAAAGVAGVALLTNEILKLAGVTTESDRILNQNVETTREWMQQQAAVAQRLSELSQATGLRIDSVKELDRLEREGLITYNELNGEWERAVDAQGNLARAASEVTKELETQQRQAHELDMQLNDLTSKERIATIQATAEVDISQIEATTERIKAALQLEGLQTQETTKRIEAMYAFNSVAVVAEADKIKAVFEGISSSIGSITGMLPDMFSMFSDNDTGLWEKSKLSGWIESAMQDQSKLVDAQVSMANAQTRLAELKIDRLQSGEALIKIESDGLEPALEQVLWSIMEKVQLRVAMEQTELLLGMGADFA